MSVAILSESEIAAIIDRAVSAAMKHSAPADTTAWDVATCASYLCISQTTVRQLVASGKIPHFRVGDRVLFHAHEIRNWKGTTATDREEGFQRELTAWQNRRRKKAV